MPPADRTCTREEKIKRAIESATRPPSGQGHGGRTSRHRRASPWLPKRPRASPSRRRQRSCMCLAVPGRWPLESWAILPTTRPSCTSRHVTSRHVTSCHVTPRPARPPRAPLHARANQSGWTFDQPLSGGQRKPSPSENVPLVRMDRAHTRGNPGTMTVWNPGVRGATAARISVALPTVRPPARRTWLAFIS